MFFLSGDKNSYPGDNYNNDLITRFRNGCSADHNDIQCAVKRMEEIQCWLSKNNQFKVLVTGQMGTGKTTLIKGLIGHYNASPLKDSLLPNTEVITSYSYTNDKINFTFFDTPDANIYSSCLYDMVKNSQEPASLLIFAVRMDSAVRKGDTSAIHSISAVFGRKVWRNAIIVLTFANRVFVEGQANRNTRENKVYYNMVRREVSMKIIQILLENKVQEDIANNIPIVPVGLVSQPIIPADERGVSWIDEFWDTVMPSLARQDTATTSPLPSLLFFPYQCLAFCIIAFLVLLPAGMCCFCWYYYYPGENHDNDLITRACPSCSPEMCDDDAGEESCTEEAPVEIPPWFDCVF